jgi:hypothetical protein
MGYSTIRSTGERIVGVGDMSSEYCTDPDSSRVRTIIQQYQQEKFQCTGSEKHFGDLTIYIRKSS